MLQNIPTKNIELNTMHAAAPFRPVSVLPAHVSGAHAVDAPLNGLTICHPGLQKFCFAFTTGSFPLVQPERKDIESAVKFPRPLAKEKLYLSKIGQDYPKKT